MPVYVWTSNYETVNEYKNYKVGKIFKILELGKEGTIKRIEIDMACPVQFKNNQIPKVYIEIYKFKILGIPFFKDLILYDQTIAGNIKMLKKNLLDKIINFFKEMKLFENNNINNIKININ